MDDGKIVTSSPPVALTNATAMGAWTTSAPALGSDRMDMLALPQDEDSSADPSYQAGGVDGAMAGRSRLSGDGGAAGATATITADNGGGNGSGGLLSRVFSRRSKFGQGSGSMKVAVAARYAVTAADGDDGGGGGGGGGDSNGQLLSVLSTESVTTAAGRGRSRRRRRQTHGLVMAFGVEDNRLGDGKHVIGVISESDDARPLSYSGDGDVDIDDDDDESSIGGAGSGFLGDGGSGVDDSRSGTRGWLPRGDRPLPGAAWGVDAAATPPSPLSMSLSPPGLQRRLYKYPTVVQVGALPGCLQGKS